MTNTPNEPDSVPELPDNSAERRNGLITWLSIAAVGVIAAVAVLISHFSGSSSRADASGRVTVNALADNPAILLADESTSRRAHWIPRPPRTF